MSDDLSRDQKFWDSHARHDPLWAILSDPTKKGRRWELAGFFQTGAREISLLLFQLGVLNIEIRRTRALDFGCGIGRLTLPLARYFDRVVGVDISAEMIRLANGLNPYPERVEYVCNIRDDLGTFPSGSFTFAYSNVVLQHIKPRAALEYLGELVRILAPGGVLVFQLPSHSRPEEERQAIAAMPDDAYRAGIRVESGIDGNQQSGTELIIAVSATNTSVHTWSRRTGTIRFGNHWLTGSGDRMLIQDDGRATLPASFAPGDTCRLSLPINVPRDPGVYQLECDLVHEGISWFGDKGSQTWRKQIEVPGSNEERLPIATAPEFVPPDAFVLPDAADAEEPGPLPMHGIRRDIIERFVREHGGEVVHEEPDERCGKEWVGYRYVVKRM